MIECLFMVFIVYLSFYILFYKMLKDKESMSPYECGFDPMSFTRLAFSYRFFLISILFMIFDVEISLMLPVPFFYSMKMLWIFFLFIMILIIGLLYEYYYGSLDWLDNYMSKV